jgi:cell division protein FtsZ
VARAAREQGILTVGVVTKPFQFEGVRRLRVADSGIGELQECVDTLIVIPNQNLFRIANEKTTFADAFAMADQVLYSGVACITDLMVKEGLINLDFADVRSVMREMGKAMMGTGEASGDRRAIQAAEAAIANPLLDETSMRGAKGLLISITGGKDLTLFEVDEAATRIREEVDPDANIILGATFDESLEGVIRCSVVATGIDNEDSDAVAPVAHRSIDAGPSARVDTPAQPAARPAPQALPPVAAAASVRKPAAAPRPQPVQAMAEKPAQPEPARSARDRDIDDEMAAAIAAEIERPPAPPGVTFTPFDPGPITYTHAELDNEPPPPSDPEQITADEPFIPPAPAAPPKKMPRVEDFPAVAQRQIEARKRGDEGADEDRGPMSLLRRLASVGLGRRDDDDPIGAGPAVRERPPTERPSTRAERRPEPQPEPAPTRSATVGRN